MDIREQLETIFKDKDFAERALMMSPGELCEALKEKGVEVSVDDIKAAGDMINAMKANGNEIDIEALDSVTGGGKAGDTAAGVIVGVFIGVAAVAVGMVCW